MSQRDGLAIDSHGRLCGISQADPAGLRRAICQARKGQAGMRASPDSPTVRHPLEVEAGPMRSGSASTEAATYAGVVVQDMEG